jgi:hypothetical protein
MNRRIKAELHCVLQFCLLSQRRETPVSVEQDIKDKRNISTPAGESKPDTPVLHSGASHYTDWVMWFTNL